MLKIKDNVDLKELKKFGFKYYNDEYTMDYENSSLDMDFIIIEQDRIIRNYTCLETEDDFYSGTDILGDWEIYKIKDLIKADLVEKVEK